jgi:hypothetical protein
MFMHTNVCTVQESNPRPLGSRRVSPPLCQSAVISIGKVKQVGIDKKLREPMAYTTNHLQCIYHVARLFYVLGEVL